MKTPILVSLFHSSWGEHLKKDVCNKRFLLLWNIVNEKERSREKGKIEREREKERDSTWLNRFNIIRIIIWDDDHLYPILSSLFLVLLLSSFLLLLSSLLYSYCIHLHVSEHCRAYYLVPSWCGSKGDREEEVNEWVNDRMRVVRVSAAAGRREERRKEKEEKGRIL